MVSRAQPSASGSLAAPTPAPLRVQRVPLERLHHDPANARLHGAGNLDAITASLKRFGQAEPLVVQAGTGMVIAGNGRLDAMKTLGWVECDIVELDVTGLDAAALGIALNRTAELAEWDGAALTKILEQLRAEDALEGVGYSGAEIDSLLDELQASLGGGGPADLDAIPKPPETPVTRAGDLWILGEHRLLCGDSSSPADLDRLLAGAPIHLVNTDPPYNVKVEPRSNNAIAAGLSSFTTTHHQKLDLARHPEKAAPTSRMRAKDRPLANDFVTGEAFDALLAAWFGNIARVLLPGRGFYIWGGYSNCGNYPPALKAAELYFSQAIIWDKQHPVLTRKDFMGAHEWCQPAGTQVLTPEGNVPIESLRDGDRVVSYSSHYNAMIGVRHGAPVVRTSRPYAGRLLGVNVAGQTTWCTPGHLWTVRLSDAAADMWCVYLMRKGKWWRAGKSKLLTSWGFGLKQRLYTEGADEAWVLSVHGSSVEAALTEQIILATYGIPLTTWSESASSRRTIADVRDLYERLDLGRMQAGALQALADHGRELQFPMLTEHRSRVKVSRRVSTLVRASNLLPGVMLVPRPDRGVAVRWEPVRAIDPQPFTGDVFSMDVEQHAHYVADGLVTHNCFYGWREGAAHQYFGPNNATDLWAVKKVNPQSMVHLTEKPVELASRAILYSSRRGENVLDLFGGSGSTLMAAEDTQRRAHLMELDLPYTDVIVTRWQNATGRQAVLEGSGRTFEQVARERAAAAPCEPASAEGKP
jgi:DNA modification methylase